LQTIGVYRESAVIASVEMLMGNVVCSYECEYCYWCTRCRKK